MWRTAYLSSAKEYMISQSLGVMGGTLMCLPITCNFALMQTQTEHKHRLKSISLAPDKFKKADQDEWS